jgi:protein-S-isoprenylcysteine O-methyltransferase Ste14
MALVWAVRRPVSTPLVGDALSVSYVLDILAVAIALGSVWLTLTAIWTLGKQWNVRATLVEDHKLITTGPYRIVRHPIYLGMLGMMIATGIAGSYWHVLLVAIVLAVAGTVVRIRYEERLLLEAFGQEFEAYRGNVRALLPWVY